MTARVLVRHPGQKAPRRGDVVVVDERPLTVARVEVLADGSHRGPRLPAGATAYRVELLEEGRRLPGRPRGPLPRNGLTYPCRHDCGAAYDTPQGRALHELGHQVATCPECGRPGKLSGLGTHRRRAHGITKATA